ncbi:MAG: glutaredoxin family protein [Thermodesulfovibrionales bacterium]
MKDFLSARGVKFTHKDVGTDKSAREELIERHGRMATPTLVIGDRVFLGFRQNRQEIEKMVDEILKGK